MKPISSSKITRRQFIRNSATGVAGVTLGLGVATPAGAAGSAKIPVGLELYSLREQCKTDLAGMIAAVSKIGYKGVEFAGYHGHSAAELRKMLDDNGIVACGTHTPYESVLKDKLQETIEFNRTIRNKFLIVPSMRAESKEAWMEKARLFNDLAQQVKAEGMSIGYHAHAHDFKKIEGETSWDIFAQHTHKEVILQLDTGNASDGGADVLAVLRKHPGRTRSIHVKPFGGGPEDVIGQDKLDWKAIFAFCETTGKTDWYVIEHESSKDPLETVKRSFEAMKKFGRA